MVKPKFSFQSDSSNYELLEVKVKDKVVPGLN